MARHRARRSTGVTTAWNRSTISSRTEYRGSCIYLVPDNAMSKFHPLTIASVARETRDAVMLTFEVPSALGDAFRFVQGQHLTLRADIGGEHVRRSYSICSAVQDDKLRIAVKKTPGGMFSTWA